MGTAHRLRQSRRVLPRHHRPRSPRGNRPHRHRRPARPPARAAATNSASKSPTKHCTPEANSSSAHWKSSTPAGSPPTRYRPASWTLTWPWSRGTPPT